MKNTTKISPGVLSMPGDIVTHASFNFRRSVRYLPLQEPIQLRLHVLPVLHLRRTVQLPVGHDQLYMAQRPQVGQWIRRRNDEVRRLSRLQRAGLLTDTRQLGAAAGGGVQSEGVGPPTYLWK